MPFSASFLSEEYSDRVPILSEYASAVKSGDLDSLSAGDRLKFIMAAEEVAMEQATAANRAGTLTTDAIDAIKDSFSVQIGDVPAPNDELAQIKMEPEWTDPSTEKAFSPEQQAEILQAGYRNRLMEMDRGGKSGAARMSIEREFQRDLAEVIEGSERRMEAMSKAADIREFGEPTFIDRAERSTHAFAEGLASLPQIVAGGTDFAASLIGLGGLTEGLEEFSRKSLRDEAAITAELARTVEKRREMARELGYSEDKIEEMYPDENSSVGNKLAASIDRVATDDRFEGDRVQAVSDAIAGTIPQMLGVATSGALGWAAGGKKAAAIAAFLASAASEGQASSASVAQELKRLGVEDDEVDAAAMFAYVEGGAISGALEMMPIHRFLSKVDSGGVIKKGLKGLFESGKTVTKQSAAEAVTEVLQTKNAQRVLVKYANIDPEELKGFDEEEKVAGLAGGIMGAVMGAFELMTKRRIPVKPGKKVKKTTKEGLSFEEASERFKDRVFKARNSPLETPEGSERILARNPETGKVEMGTKRGETIEAEDVSGEGEGQKVKENLVEVEFVSEDGVQKVFAIPESQTGENVRVEFQESLPPPEPPSEKELMPKKLVEVADGTAEMHIIKGMSKEDIMSEADTKDPTSPLYEKTPSVQLVDTTEGVAVFPSEKSEADIEAALSEESGGETDVVPLENDFPISKNIREIVLSDSDLDADVRAALEAKPVKGTRMKFGADVAAKVSKALEDTANEIDSKKMAGNMRKKAREIEGWLDTLPEEGRLDPDELQAELDEEVDHEANSMEVKDDQRSFTEDQIGAISSAASKVASNGTKPSPGKRYGIREGGVIEFFKTLAEFKGAISTISKGVGANIGDYVLTESALGTAVLELEPDPDTSGDGNSVRSILEDAETARMAKERAKPKPKKKETEPEKPKFDDSSVNELSTAQDIRLAIRKAKKRIKISIEGARVALGRIEKIPEADRTFIQKESYDLYKEVVDRVDYLEGIIKDREAPKSGTEAADSPVGRARRKLKDVSEGGELHGMDSDAEVEAALAEIEATIPPRGKRLDTKIDLNFVSPTANRMVGKLKKFFLTITGRSSFELGRSGKHGAQPRKIGATGKVTPRGFFNREAANRNIEEVGAGEAGLELESMERGMESRIQRDAVKIVKDIKKRIDRAVGRGSGDAITKLVRIALQDRRAILYLKGDPILQKAVLELSNLRDTLAQEISYVNASIDKVLTENLGTYMARSYLNFDKRSDWSYSYLKLQDGKDPAATSILKAAREWFSKYRFEDDGARGKVVERKKPATPAQVERAIKEFMHHDRSDFNEADIVSALNNMAANKELPNSVNLRMKKALPPVLRNLLGEVRDPVAMALRTTSIQSQMLAKLRAQEAMAGAWLRDGVVREEGAELDDDVALFAKNPTNAFAGMFQWKAVIVKDKDGNNVEQWVPTRYYTDEKTAEMIEGMFTYTKGDTGVLGMIGAILTAPTAMLKTSLVGWNAKQVPVSFAGAVWQGAFAGANTLKVLFPMFNKARWSSFGKEGDGLVVEAKGRNPYTVTQADGMRMAREGNVLDQSVLARDQAFGENVDAGLENDLNPFKNFLRNFKDVALNNSGDFVLKRMVRAYTSAGQITVGKPDEAVRIQVFFMSLGETVKAAQYAINNRDKGAKFYGLEISSYPDDATLGRIAAARAAKSYINYGRIPRLATLLSRIGAISTFSSFFFDLARATAGAVKVASEDIAVGKRDKNKAMLWNGVRKSTIQSALIGGSVMAVTKMMFAAYDKWEDIMAKYGVAASTPQGRERARKMNESPDFADMFRRSGAAPIFNSSSHLVFLKAEGPKGRRITYALPEYASPLSVFGSALANPEGQGWNGILGPAENFADNMLGYTPDEMGKPGRARRLLPGIMLNKFVNVITGTTETGAPAPRKPIDRVAQEAVDFIPRVFRDGYNILNKDSRTSLRRKEFDTWGLSNAAFVAPLRAYSVDLDERLRGRAFSAKDAKQEHETEIKRIIREEAGDPAKIAEEKDKIREEIKDYWSDMRDFKKMGGYSNSEIREMEKKAGLSSEMVFDPRERREAKKRAAARKKNKK